MAVKACNNRSTGLLIGAHDLTQVFEVESFRKRCGPYQVTEHHRELTAFRFRRRCYDWWCLG